jgi:predicted small integral membrane protein
MTNMAWRIVLATYMAFYIVAYCDRTAWPCKSLSPRADVRRGVVPDCAVRVGLCGLCTSNRLNPLVGLWRFTTVERDDRPVAYWLAVGFFFLYGALLIVLGVKR